MTTPTRRDVLKTSVLSLSALVGAPLLLGCEDMQDAAAHTTLKRLLSECHAHELRHGYMTRVNHAPMVLIALFRLGATAERLQAYSDALKRPTHDITPRQRKIAITPTTWTKSFGRSDTLHAYATYFRTRIKAVGTDATIAAHGPELLRGAAAAAFHPLIKLGYAVDIGDPEETALALAYWCTTHEPVPVVPAQRTPIPFAEFIASLAADKTLKSVRTRGNIVDRVRLVYRTPAFRNLLRPIKIDAEDPLGAMGKVVMDAFATTHHFTVLHALTSTQALRLIISQISDPQGPLTAFGHALGAAYLTAVNMSRHDLARPVPEAVPDLAALRAAGVRATDDHTIKITYSCIREFEASRREMYLRLAARDQTSAARFT